MKSKPEILICLPDLPYPARKNGISIRYFPILRHISQFFRVHLLCIVDIPPQRDEIEQAEKDCEHISIHVRQKKPVSTLTKLILRTSSLIPSLNDVPFSYLCYDQKNIEQFIKTETRGKTYSVALCVCANYAHLIKKHINADKYSLDFIDSPFATELRKCDGSYLAKLDLLAIKKWEEGLIKKYDATSYISPLDKEIGTKDFQPEYDINIIPNGLFQTDQTSEKINYGEKTIGYLGNMSYPPNVKAALRLHRIFSQNRERYCNAKLVIIGRDPSPEINELQQDPSVIITGNVDNIWPYINGIDIFVFPMEIGSGQQNKILETMGAGKVVITTDLGNSGIGAKNGYNIVVANEDQDIANHIERFINAPDNYAFISSNAKAFISTEYDWPKINERFCNRMLAINP